MIASAIAGPFAWLICYPIEVLRIQTQQHASLPRDVLPAIRQVLREPGWSPSFWYRGLPMACLNLGGTNAVQFGATGVFQKWMASSGFVQDQVQVGGAFLGGAASGLPCSLWELCMIQQQRFGGSIGSTMSRLVSEHGAGVTERVATLLLSLHRGIIRRLAVCTCRPPARLDLCVGECGGCRCRCGFVPPARIFF